MTTVEQISEGVKTQITKLERAEPSFKHLLDALKRVGRVGVVGGAVRDWVFGYAPRDLDLVVGGDAMKLEELFQHERVERTRFGGFRLERGGIQVDLWALSTTWAFRDGALGTPSFDALPKTAFFSADAIVVSLDSFTVHEHRFIDSFAANTLAVNYERNPFPELCVVRSIVLSSKFALKPDEGLNAFVRAQYQAGLDWVRFDSAQRSHYGKSVVDAAAFARHKARLLPDKSS